jgi:hypothetical protein
MMRISISHMVMGHDKRMDIWKLFCDLLAHVIHCI